MTNLNNRNTNTDISNSGSDAKYIDDLIRKNNINSQVFHSIKKLQQIPDEVIIDFLKAESFLYNSEFKKRVISDDEQS